jgi:transmembrane protein TMEM260 (protein O-mannosyltransferase)
VPNPPSSTRVTTAPTVGLRIAALEATGAAVATAILYLATLAGNHSETEDTIPFAVRLRDYPHSDAPHLIYDWFSWCAYHLARALGVTNDPLRPAQVKNALFGAAVVGILWLILRRAGRTRLVAATASGVLALSYGFWWNNVEGDVYAISAFTAVLCLALAYRAVEQPSTRSFAFLGLANGVAVLAHTANVFFAGVAAAALLLARHRGTLRRWWKPGAAYALTASAVVIPAYAIAAAILNLGSVHAFREWFTATTGQGQFGHVNSAMFAKGAVADGRALIGGHFALSFGFVERFITRHFPDRPLREEYFFLHGYSHTLAVFLLALTAVVVLLVVVLAASWARRPNLDARGRTLAFLCLAWMVSYLPILLYWDPFNIELWYVFWIPGAILLALPLNDARRLFPGRVATVVAATLLGSLLTVNLFGSVWPQHDNSKDYWRVRAEWYRAHTSPSDTVLATGYLETGYLGYLTKARVVDADRIFVTSNGTSAAIAEIRRQLRSGRPKHVYISGEVFHPFADVSAGCRAGPAICNEATALRRAFLGHSRLLVRQAGEQVWELSSAGSLAAVQSTPKANGSPVVERRALALGQRLR